MSYEHLIIECESDRFQTIKNIITINELDSSSRKRENVYRRFFLYNELRSMSEFKSLKWIGKLFNRDHSSVVHGLSVHDILTEIKDPMYNQIKTEMNSALGHKRIDKNKILRDRIKSCKSLHDMNRIKQLVETNQL